MSEPRIPTYSPDGSPIRDYPLSTVVRLLDLGRVTVQRNRHQRIVSAHYRSDGGGNPLPKTVHMGQKYSFPERIPDTALHVWQHKQLPRAETGCDLFVRAVFRRVQIDCIAKPNFRALAKECAPTPEKQAA